MFNGQQYYYEYDSVENYLQLKTHDQEYNIGVEFICKETVDTERRWREFQRLFAASVANKNSGVHG